MLEDLDSKNGTFLRGTRVTAPVPLVDCDEICIAQEVLVVRYCVPEGSTASGGAVRTETARPVEARATAPSAPSPAGSEDD